MYPSALLVTLSLSNSFILVETEMNSTQEAIYIVGWIKKILEEDGAFLDGAFIWTSVRQES